MRTKKLKRRRQNGGNRGITFINAKRLLTNMSPGTALKNMAISLMSKKVSPASSELSASSASSELSASPGTESQGSLEEAIAKLTRDYDKALPETLDEIIVLMRKYEADLRTVIRILKRVIKNMNIQININTETEKIVAKKIEKLKTTPKDKVYEKTIRNLETTIIQAGVNLQTSNNNLKVLNEALTKYKTAHTDVQKKKWALLKQQRKQNGDNNSEIIVNFKQQWIDIQKTLHEAQEVIKQQKEKIAINASRQASPSANASASASASANVSANVSATRQATYRKRATATRATATRATTTKATTTRANTTRATTTRTRSIRVAPSANTTGGKQIRRTRKK